MSVAVCLLLYGAAVCVIAPRLLPYLTRGGAAPGAAVGVWLVVVASVLGSWIGAAAALAVHAARTWNRPDPFAVSACLAEVRSAAIGHSGLAMQAGLVAATAMLSAFLMMLGYRAGRFVITARSRSRHHAASARIIGRRVAGVDGLVVDAPQKMAYCLGGRPATVVITSAAVAALDRPQLDAVLAHERAHLAGRHHLLLAAVRALAVSLPRIRLFSVAHTEIVTLLEMCADDTAARQHGPQPLLSGISTLIGVAPATALGAAHTAVLARAQRLTVLVGAPVRWGDRLAQTAAIGVTLALPVLAGLTCLM